MSHAMMRTACFFCLIDWDKLVDTKDVILLEQVSDRHEWVAEFYIIVDRITKGYDYLTKQLSFGNRKVIGTWVRRSTGKIEFDRVNESWHGKVYNNELSEETKEVYRQLGVDVDS